MNQPNPFSKWQHCQTLKRKPNAWSGLKLDPLPIFRDEAKHKYCWEPTGEWLAFSTTQACNDKSPAAMANIEKYRHIWEPRGVHVHWTLQQKMLGDPNPDPGEFKEWVEPLMNHEYWKCFEPWAVEYMLCDLSKSVGGQLDLLGYDHAVNQLVLIDLKTQGKNKGIYSTDAQLGSYVDALANHHGIVVDACRTVWSRPGKTVIGEIQDPLTCRLAWADAWEKFEEKQEFF